MFFSRNAIKVSVLVGISIILVIFAHFAFLSLFMPIAVEPDFTRGWLPQAMIY